MTKPLAIVEMAGTSPKIRKPILVIQTIIASVLSRIVRAFAMGGDAASSRADHNENRAGEIAREPHRQRAQGCPRRLPWHAFGG